MLGSGACSRSFCWLLTLGAPTVLFRGCHPGPRGHVGSTAGCFPSSPQAGRPWDICVPCLGLAAEAGGVQPQLLLLWNRPLKQEKIWERRVVNIFLGHQFLGFLAPTPGSICPKLCPLFGLISSKDPQDTFTILTCSSRPLSSWGRSCQTQSNGTMAASSSQLLHRSTHWLAARFFAGRDVNFESFSIGIFHTSLGCN